MLDKYLKNRILKKGMEIEDSMMTATSEAMVMIEKAFGKKSLNAIWFFVIVSLLFLLGRVFYLDVVKGSYYAEISRENRIRSFVAKAPRGNILDKYGKILAKNVPSLDAVIIPVYLSKDSEQRKKEAKIISEILEINLGNSEIILEAQNFQSYEPVLLKENISQDQALMISEKEREIPGIVVEKSAIRSYEDSVILAHIIGYDGKITREELKENEAYLMTDYIGKSGIEKSYEKQLRGRYGSTQVEIDSTGKVKKVLGMVNPEPGDELILNIDEELQKKLYDGLSVILEKSQTRTAAAAAIDPRTGGILALVSLPSFDNNLFARGINNEEYKNIISDKDLPLFNRVLSGVYPPGSTLKPAVAAAALSEKIISEDTTVNCPGEINIGSWRFGDWKTHGTVDVRKAIAESCDVFFYSVGGGYGNINGLGMDRMKKYENLFGFGNLTGVDIPQENAGFIPDEDWKYRKLGEKWYIGDSYHSSIGQGFITVTPLQLANYTAAIANSGTLFSPKVVNQIKKNNGEVEYIKPKVIRQNFISPEIMKVVREGMRQTVTSGTAQSLKDLPVEAAGKTGTAQFGTEDKTHAWFISFAPFDNPSIAMVVLVEGGGEGSSLALPVTKEVYDWYFNR
jgi:penicillin-binding protein 2